MFRFRSAMIAASLTTMLAGAVAAEGIALRGVLTDAEDGNRFFTRLGGEAQDLIAYRGLTPGQSYVIVSRLINTETGERLEGVNTEFTPESAEGEVAVIMPVPRNGTKLNINYTSEVSLNVAGTALGAEGYIGTINGDPKDPERTIQVHSVQRVSVLSVADTADGDLRIDATGGEIDVRVGYENMVEGYPYTFWGQLLTPSGQAIGAFASIPEFAPEGKHGEVVLTFRVPEGYEGISLTPSVGVYHKKRVEILENGNLSWIAGSANPVMIASDVDLADKSVAIEVGTPFDAE